MKISHLLLLFTVLIPFTGTAQQHIAFASAHLASQYFNQQLVESSSLHQGQRVHPKDSLALVALYFSAGGSSWKNNTHWLSHNKVVENWYGVTVKHGRVTGINLSGNFSYRPTHTLPPEIGDLDSLKVLKLPNNQLSGKLPPELGRLQKLQTLDLSSNQLSGPLPQTLGHLVSLRNLDLGANQLSGSIPKVLGNLTSLDTLNLCLNRLTGRIPAELAQLARLKTLSLFNNQLNGPIPKAILQNLTGLEVLHLSDNQLSGSLPEELFHLSQLKFLMLSSNQLNGIIPEEIGNLKHLKILSLFSNQLQGTLPKAIGSIKPLKHLALSFNQLQGSIPAEWQNLRKLHSLSLSYNALRGSVPPGLATLPELKYLELGNNKLADPLPPRIAQMKSLKTLDLSCNRFSSLPDLSGLQMEFLEIHHNALTFADLDSAMIEEETLHLFTYRSQEQVPLLSDTTGNCVALSAGNAGGQNAQFQWFANGTRIPGANQKTYRYPAGSGLRVHCVIKNPDYPELTLQSTTVKPVAGRKHLQKQPQASMQDALQINCNTYRPQEQAAGSNSRAGLFAGPGSSPVIYPNPARHRITIQARKLKTIKLLSPTGQVLLQKVAQSPATTLDVHPLKPGLYILHLEKESGRIASTKLVVK